MRGRKIIRKNDFDVISLFHICVCMFSTLQFVTKSQKQYMIKTLNTIDDGVWYQKTWFGHVENVKKSDIFVGQWELKNQIFFH